MPGIVGFITTDPRPDHNARVLESMSTCMFHEAFYQGGTYLAPDVGCYVRWIDHDACRVTRNPLVNSTKTTALVLAGEHFGAPLSSLESGIAIPDGLNGWFSGVLIDHANRSATLFVDRFAMHRLYYAVSDDRFLFASEAKSLLAVLPECRSFDPHALGQFVTFGCVFDNRTLYRGISLMPGGSAWTFAGSVTPKTRVYFNTTDWAGQPILPHNEYMERLKGALTDAVPRYSSAQQPVGVSLTAGLDTRIIMAAAPLARDNLRCYTYAGRYRECFDVLAASQIADRCGLPFTAIPMNADFFSGFESLAAKTVWITDGCSDISGAHELYFSQRARQISSIRLTGNYGSEVLRGQSTFKPNDPGRALALATLRPYIEEARMAYGALRSRSQVQFAVSAEIPWHLYGRFAVAQSQLTLRSPYMDNAVVALAFRAPANLRRPGPPWLQLIEALNPALSTVTTDMGWNAHETSTRSLARRLYRYALFKAEWYYNLGMPEWLSGVDRQLLRVFEPIFLGTHKIDHYRLWFRDELSSYIRSMVSSAARSGQPYVNRAWCEEFVNSDRISGQQALDVSRLITLELIQSQLLRTPGSAQLSRTPEPSLVV